jgi:hypothetical protein
MLKGSARTQAALAAMFFHWLRFAGKPAPGFGCLDNS